MKIVFLKEDEREMLLGLTQAAHKGIRTEIDMTEAGTVSMEMHLQTRRVLSRLLGKLSKRRYS